MLTRRLGDRNVSAVGLGCMSMSWGYVAGDVDDAESIATIHRALELGVTFFDTADVYGPFTNEELVGRALAGSDAVIATKVGLLVGPSGGYPLDQDARPERIRPAAEASLRRLGREAIDLYYLHRVDPNVPVEETWGAMAELVDAGLVRALGLSEANVEVLEKAHAIQPVTALQSELSLWTREPLMDVIPWCAEHGTTFVPFAPLGRGYLTGALSDAAFDAKDFRASNPRFTADALHANRAILEGIAAVAERHGATPAQVAIAWTLAQGEHIVPIPGTRRRRWLEENVGALQIELTPEDLSALDSLPSASAPRY